eukprot:5657325-Heterocapsa_arctica.AAC.1
MSWAMRRRHEVPCSGCTLHHGARQPLQCLQLALAGEMPAQEQMSPEPGRLTAADGLTARLANPARVRPGKA